MSRPVPTEIKINKYGDETHESWVLIRAGKISCSPPGERLFDSEINHHHYIQITVTSCSRKRDLNHDWIHSDKVLMELKMSQAQWGAFVSSFGDGSGVPATLQFFRALDGVGPEIPQAPFESRLEESHKEVRDAGARAISEIQEAFDAVEQGFQEKLGRKELAQRISTLHYKIENAPGNMAFAAESLTKHVEKVVTKARADIEGMAYEGARRGELARVDALGLNVGSEQGVIDA